MPKKQNRAKQSFFMFPLHDTLAFLNIHIPFFLLFGISRPIRRSIVDHTLILPQNLIGTRIKIMSILRQYRKSLGLIRIFR